jgi:hypothetical protein
MNLMKPNSYELSIAGETLAITLAVLVVGVVWGLIYVAVLAIRAGV